MNYTLYNKVIIRTPFNPLKSSFSLDELIELFSKEDVSEALFLASPELLSEFRKSLAKGNIEEDKKLIYSLLKYALRIHNRCTPFGLFAGCGVSDWADNYTIINSNKRSTRLDMMFSFELAQEISKNNQIRPFLTFLPNTSIYEIHDQIRYIEYHFKNKRRIHQLCEIEKSEYLTDILNYAKQGKSINELSLKIISDDITYDEAHDFILEMIDSQLLVSELDIAVTGEEPLTQIIEVLESIRNSAKVEIDTLYQQVIKIKQCLNILDTNTDNNAAYYSDITAIIEEFNIPYDIGKLFQTDLYTTIENNNQADEKISEEVNNTQNSILKAVKVLNKLTPKYESTNLSRFQDEFFSRYESREISLSEALDSESGIGYGSTIHNKSGVSPLIEGLNIFNSNKTEENQKLSKVHRYLLKKLTEANSSGSYTIKIDENELTDFADDWDDLPVSMSILFNYIGENDNKIVIKSVGSASANNLLGRFSKANQDIYNVVTDISNAEKEHFPNAVIAQIAHLPDNRIGNVLFRPILRDFEIPFLCGSQLPIKNRIFVDDLFISVRNNKVILRSNKLNKEVIPRLDNAHSFSKNAIPVYHFLCDLQTQGLRGGIPFDWGRIIEDEFKFLPRVTVGNVIISLAKWHLSQNDFQYIITESKKSPPDFLDSVIKWRTNFKIPQLVVLAESDNDLLINFDDQLNLLMFVSILEKTTKVVLKEYLFQEDKGVINNSSGKSFSNEFVAVLLKEKKESVRYLTPNTSQKGIIKRDFSVGSEWLYYKIYCGIKSSDKLLVEVLQPLCKHLIDNKLIDSWFFIRYSDPKTHLRIRFHLIDLSKIGDVINIISSYLNEPQQSGLFWKVQIDTYSREIERYGESTIQLSENLFFYDSIFTIKLIQHTKDHDDERWKFAIFYIDSLLTKFNFSLLHKKELFENLKESFAAEFRIDKYSKMALDKRYREKRKPIYDIINNKNLYAEFIEDEKYSNLETLTISSILKANEKNSVPLINLMSSYIHMSLNRIFRYNQRRHELVVYDFLWRYYRSEIAKKQFSVEYADGSN